MIYCSYDSQTSQHLYYEISHVIPQYQGLKPQVRPFVAESIQCSLLSLVGTIQVYFVNATYNVPISVTYPNGYPSVKPYVLVEPTPKMIIKPSDYVTPSGEVKLDLLNRWNTSCNTFQLLHEVTRAFEIFMPVYSKRDAHDAPAHPPADEPKTLMDDVYLATIEKLTTDINELERDARLLERKEHELKQVLNSQNTGLDDQLQKIKSTKHQIKDWIQKNSGIECERLEIGDLVDFANPAVKQQMELQAQVEGCEEAARAIIEAFHANSMSLKDLIRGLKISYSKAYMTGKMKEWLLLNR